LRQSSRPDARDLIQNCSKFPRLQEPNGRTNSIGLVWAVLEDIFGPWV